jgi:glycosyltransferase involved in cell wall biosynthesis
LLFEEVLAAGLAALPGFEMILVDDGSTDSTGAVIQRLSSAHRFVRGFSMERRAGKSAAWHLGFREARGDVIVTLDADLQNNPRDVHALLARMVEGVDLASAVRKKRADGSWRAFQSRTANFFRRTLLGDDTTDSGCGMKALRRRALWGIPMFAGFHRFLEPLFTMNGFRVEQVPVGHRIRRFGFSKYGISNRLSAPMVDLVGTTWLKRRKLNYDARPITHEDDDDSF